MNFTFGLIISLGLNVALAAGVVHSRKTAADAERPTGTPVTVELKSAVVSTSAPIVEDVKAVKPFHWRQLEADDYRQYVANLRAIKCPESIIRDIVYADLEKVLAKKFRALNTKYKINRDGSLSDYWKSDDELAKVKLARDVEGRLQHAERRESLISLLGMDVEKERRDRLGLPDDEGAKYPFLTTQKLGQVRDLWAEFDTREKEAQFKYQGYSAEELKTEFRDIARQRDAAVAAILSPSEKEEYLLRISYISGVMRNSLESFQPTEQEFRALFKLEYQQFLDLGPYAYHGNVDSEDQTLVKKVAEDKERKDAAIRNLLGEDRYIDYFAARNPDYAPVAQAVQSSGLSKQVAMKVYDIKKATDAETRKLFMNPQLTGEQRQEAMAAIQQTRANALKGLMGEAAFLNYEQASRNNTIRPGSFPAGPNVVVPQKVIQR